MSRFVRAADAGLRAATSGGYRAKVCTVCGHYADPVQRRPGSSLITIVLLCCAIVPGVIYALWRGSAAYEACAACGGRSLVPADTPAGRRLLESVR